MSNAPKNASERIFQQKFVNELSKYKWELPTELDGTKQKVTVEDLIKHWRKELNRLNTDQLEGIELTDAEFQQVLSKVNRINNSYEAAKILSIEDSKGKIDGIYRDPNPKVTKQQIALTIFKRAQVSGGDSSYKIAREVVTANNNRFDIVLLINGLPLINIEQKRTDKSLDEAFGQFKRYYKDGEYTNGFMAFSQMMVITTEIETRYFATPKSVNDFNPAFVFHWSDKVNKPINNWAKVVETFLMIPMAHQMVGDYLVIDEDKEVEANRRHMLMRPYQVYALQAVEAAAIGWDNGGVPHGGFVWHTTGSGKTVTSFKTALFLSIRAGFDKVVFLLDRREIDNKTTEKFEAYAAYESVDVSGTKSTNMLRRSLRESKHGIVVTTTFKLNALIKSLVEGHDYSLTDKKIIFIIDEAHRTTMGQMMGDIKNYFKKNGLFYGFTGTPLFDENKVKGKFNEKSEVINTTEKLFGPELHQYTIDEAIRDKNVLGFHIDYLNTGEFRSYEDLREKLTDKIGLERPDLPEREIERITQSWSEVEVEKNAAKEGLLIYQDETHIPRVVAEILENWQNQSQQGEFNAILTVAYKSRVLAYYNEFKKQIAEKFKEDDEKPNIAMTFSFGNENSTEQVASEVIKDMFKDYAKFTGIEYVVGDAKHGEDAYFEDIINRLPYGGSGLSKKNIDFVIVADQLLTGYDSKLLNTLYVDRGLELQGLIQAYSRTNRVFGPNKEFGTIINFQYPRITEETVNKALELYGSGGSSSPAIVDFYETAVKKLKIKMDALVVTLEDPTEWASLRDDEEGKTVFKLAFFAALDKLNFVQQYYEYEWNDITFGLDEHKWLQYMGAYKNLFPSTGGEEVVEPIKTLAGKTKLQGTQVINAAHILSLIGKKVDLNGAVQSVDSETLRIIHEQIQELSSMGEAEQASLLKEFVDTELVLGHISTNINFDEAFENWRKDKEDALVTLFAEEWGIDDNLLSHSLSAYVISNRDVIPYIDEIIRSVDFSKAKNQSAGNKLRHNMRLTQALPKWLLETKQQFN
ncbi:type I restriction enzyme R protein [Weissella oryzae SG25]|uniref:Type I restriction enzyme endonuclease subunit n=1 Tax=Weissella oryzae (strain DSM 25784 / JCM 18191 / LMG 30913 / SG25) TaxID=1329250 RepID=A0A069CQI2_WEIOS|nr:HsdR family type I site-specific deoxyribonuclease [Weissella oryzae]GAK29925.1 type I restriction enzyme R protein [Weissella oryzae SG25]